MRGHPDIFEDAAETLLGAGAGVFIVAAAALWLGEAPAFFALMGMAAGCFVAVPAVLVAGLVVGSRQSAEAGSRQSAVGSRKGE